MQKGAVYYVSKGTLKPAQKTYNHLKSDWEITLDSASSIEPAGEDTSIQVGLQTLGLCRQEAFCVCTLGDWS